VAARERDVQIDAPVIAAPEDSGLEHVTVKLSRDTSSSDLGRRSEEDLSSPADCGFRRFRNVGLPAALTRMYDVVRNARAASHSAMEFEAGSGTSCRSARGRPVDCPMCVSAELVIEGSARTAARRPTCEPAAGEAGRDGLRQSGTGWRHVTTPNRPQRTRFQEYESSETESH